MNYRKIAITAVVALISCHDPFAAFEDVAGDYHLISHNNTALPTNWVCGGGLRILDGLISLDDRGNAEYVLHYESGSQPVTFDGSGRYEVDGSVVTVNVFGSWSHLEQPTVRTTYVFEFDEAHHKLIRRNVGQECDASTTEEYVE
jgi:hypothetical protein